MILRFLALSHCSKIIEILGRPLPQPKPLVRSEATAFFYETGTADLVLPPGTPIPHLEEGVHIFTVTNDDWIAISRRRPYDLIHSARILNTHRGQADALATLLGCQPQVVSAGEFQRVEMEKRSQTIADGSGENIDVELSAQSQKPSGFCAP